MATKERLEEIIEYELSDLARDMEVDSMWITLALDPKECKYKAEVSYATWDKDPWAEED